MRSREIIHLYNRIGFGVGSHLNISDLEKRSKQEIVRAILSDTAYETLEIDVSDITSQFQFGMRPDRKKLRALLKESTSKLKDYNHAWIDRLCNTNELLREKMTLFWANHFVCHDKNIVHIQQYNNMLRKYALGDFRALLLEVSKSASMSKYLNNKQNKKSSPNENFARELMELFTLGRDHYTEPDIKEAARAFTGWSHNLQGEFMLRSRLHDYGKKTFFGEEGYFGGEDIIDIILKQKQCAVFICEKVYRYFVNDQLNKEHVDQMVTVFYQDYNIKRLMEFVLLSDWFYDEVNIGTKIKSPIEFLVGINNMVTINFTNPKELLYLQKLLGQVLLFPPNVAGWKGGRNWIDTNTMMLRLKLPSILLANGVIALDEKNAFEDSFDKFNRRRGMQKRLHVDVNWNQFNKHILNPKELQERLLVTVMNKGTKKYINQLDKNNIESYCIQLMSLPEYQLC